MLAEYNKCVPNGAERILALAERQAKHRQELEGSVVHGNLKATVRGQVFAFILGLIIIVGGFRLVGQGKDAQGLAAIVTAVAGKVEAPSQLQQPGFSSDRSHSAIAASTADTFGVDVCGVAL